MTKAKKVAITSKDVNFISVVTQHKRHSSVSAEFLKRYLREALESKNLSKDAYDIACLILESDGRLGFSGGSKSAKKHKSAATKNVSEKQQIADRFQKWLKVAG